MSGVRRRGRYLPWALAAAALAVPLAEHPARASRESRPNVLFVFSDDHAAQAVSAYGSVINTTPNIDRIAREGMLFRNAFVTNSICAPSRAVVLTGTHSHVNGIVDNTAVLDGSQPLLPRLLQSGGYQTAIIGKWHLKSEPVGFDHWEVLPGFGSYFNPDFLTPSGLEKNRGHVTRVITDKVLSWLESGRDPDRPFLLMYQDKAPHRPWQPSLEDVERYGEARLPEPETLFDDYAGRSRAARLQRMTIARDLDDGDLKFRPPREADPEQLRAWDAAYGPRNEAFLAATHRKANTMTWEDVVRWRYQRYIKDYLRTVAAIDRELGRVLDYLDSSGLARNTVVVYSSDQGFFLGEHGWFDKRFMYEESLRVPLVVRWPGVVAPGSLDEHLVQNLDFAPTLLEMAGVDVPASMQGRSLVPLLRGGAPSDWRDSIYYHFYEYPGAHSVHRHYGVRTARYKLIHFYELGEWELYDLESDPRELSSVHDAQGYAWVRRELEAELARLREHYAVPDEDPAPTGAPATGGP